MDIFCQFTSNRENSKCTSSFYYNIVAFDQRHFVLLDISKKIVAFVDDRYPNLHDAAICRSVFSDFLILSRIREDKNYIEEQREICDNLMRMKTEIYCNKEINVKQKVKVVIVSLFRKLRKI